MNQWITDIYSKHEHIKISENFWSDEFKCKCRSTTCTATLIGKKMLNVLQDIRTELGYRFKPNSAYRCPRHNKSKPVRGGNISTHLMGYAVDIPAKNGFTPIDIAELAERFMMLHDVKGGIGIYTKKNFCHIDVRHWEKARWTD